MLLYFKGFCQLVNYSIRTFLLSFVLLSCSRTQLIPYRPVEAVPQWFKSDENFSFRTDEGDYLIHPYFDHLPMVSNDDHTINFLLVTPQDSEFSYQFDIVSGQRVVAARHCEQEDVWGKFDDEVYLPPFTEGVIPRLLDPLGDPYRVIVFGRKNFYIDQNIGYLKTHRVRVIGGINLQYCAKKMCRSREWLSTVIPVAVDQLDSSFKKIDNLEQLKSKVDWDYVKAFLQNGKGRSLKRGGDIPAYRYLSEMDGPKTFELLVTKAYQFQYPKMIEMRNGCHKLYQYMWDSSLQIRESKKRIYRTDAQKIEIFKKELFERNVISTEEVEQKKKKEEKMFEYNKFSKWFSYFYGKYGDDYEVCSRYVKSSNFEANRQRHWFFAYIDLFFKMQKVGFVYSCSNQSWVDNYRNSKGEWVYSQKELLKTCTDFSLDRSFERASNYMLRKQQSDEEYFRYVSQDATMGGSHQKVYSWVNFSGKKMRCTEEEEEGINRMVELDQIFSQATQWLPFSVRYKKRYDIIR